MQHFVALVHGEAGAYGVSFPDFPGCISGGDTIEQTIASGVEALHFHIEGTIEEGVELPQPSPIEAIRANEEFAEDLDGALVMLVPVLTPAGKPVRINISLDQALVEQIDRAAEKAKQTRSGFLA